MFSNLVGEGTRFGTSRPSPYTQTPCRYGCERRAPVRLLQRLRIHCESSIHSLIVDGQRKKSGVVGFLLSANTYRSYFDALVGIETDADAGRYRSIERGKQGIDEV